MGKRSNFKRSKGDFYVTPPSAVVPLAPHLPQYTTFFEPCAGDGALIDALHSLEHTCAGAMDINPQHSSIEKGDALRLTEDRFDPHPMIDAIITNPPWTRSLLHPMIERFSALRPTWLLFDADWMHTKQARPYLAMCHKIVSVGRVSWMGNGVSGKDNAAWYLFDQVDPPGQPKFYGR